jgi:hypothetical protein
VLAFAAAASGVGLWAFLDRGAPVDDPPFTVWLMLILALGVTSGAVFVAGARRQASVDQVRAVDWTPLKRAGWSAAAVVLALTLLNLVAAPRAGTVRGILLMGLAIVGATPSVVALLGVRRAATAAPPGDDLGTRLHGYLELRSIGLRVLPPLGALVALMTFALGASRRSAPSGAADTVAPVEMIVALGVVGTALVGLAYALPSHALRAEALVLRDTLCPIEAGESAELRRQLGEREDVEHRLGISGSVVGDLQTRLAVFGPLLTATVALFLPAR